jgi:hypothetical protein
MGLSTINIGECESQLGWVKENTKAYCRKFLQLGRGGEMSVECWETTYNHSGFCEKLFVVVIA